MTKTGDAARPPLDLPPESASIGEWFQRYQKPVLVGALVAAVGAGAWWMAGRSAEIKEVRAGEALMAAEAAYTNGGPEAAQVEFQKVIARYAGTTAGTQAALLSAQWHYEAGRADSGMASIAAVLNKAPSYRRAGLLATRAHGQALKGDHAAAAKDFQAAAAATKLVGDRDSYLMEAARAFVAAGDTSAAEQILNDLATREDSPFSGEARLRLGEIKAKA